VVDDLVSNASWLSARFTGSYFEGNNILVKIDGSDPHYQNHSGVLFSAHYDSVATAPGATDDGMGVSVLLHMIKYLVANRPRRTAVFNINNGEEDGLHGAHA
jgi:Zn-dependent M28 family amino/carboxypeptidase